MKYQQTVTNRKTIPCSQDQLTVPFPPSTALPHPKVLAPFDLSLFEVARWSWPQCQSHRRFGGVFFAWKWFSGFRRGSASGFVSLSFWSPFDLCLVSSQLSPHSLPTSLRRPLDLLPISLGPCDRKELKPQAHPSTAHPRAAACTSTALAIARSFSSAARLRSNTCGEMTSHKSRIELLWPATRRVKEKKTFV